MATVDANIVIVIVVVAVVAPLLSLRRRHLFHLAHHHRVTKCLHSAVAKQWEQLPGERVRRRARRRLDVATDSGHGGEREEHEVLFPPPSTCDRAGGTRGVEVSAPLSEGAHPPTHVEGGLCRHCTLPLFCCNARRRRCRRRRSRRPLSPAMARAILFQVARTVRVLPIAASMLASFARPVLFVGDGQRPGAAGTVHSEHPGKTAQHLVQLRNGVPSEMVHRLVGRRTFLEEGEEEEGNRDGERTPDRRIADLFEPVHLGEGGGVE